MKKKVLAVSAAGLLGGMGLASIEVTPAGAASAPAPVHLSAQPNPASGQWKLTPAGQAMQAKRAVIAAGGGPAGLGELTFADNDAYAANATATVTAVPSGTVVGSDSQTATEYSPPLQLPAGTYQVSVNDGTVPAYSGVVTIGAGQDISASAQNGAPGSLNSPVLRVVQYTDNLPAATGGNGVVSFRDGSAQNATVEVYIDGTDEGAVPGGGSKDIAVPSGAHTVLVKAGGPNGQTVLLAPGQQILADNYYPAYLIDAPSNSQGAGGASPGYGAAVGQFKQGYRFEAADGGVFAYGGYPFGGSEGGTKLAAPIVGGARTFRANPYYLVGADGGVFALGGAPFKGSMGGVKLAKPVVGMATDAGNGGTTGYVLLGADGGVFNFNTPYNGGLVGQLHGSPAVAIAMNYFNGTYYIAQADGTVTAFSAGSAPTVYQPPVPKLAAPIVGIALNPPENDGQGFYLVAADGGVFAEAGAPFEGSAASLTLAAPVTSVVPSFDGLGYNLIAKDGGVFSYGDAPFYGSAAGENLVQPVVGAMNA